MQDYPGLESQEGKYQLKASATLPSGLPIDSTRFTICLGEGGRYQAASRRLSHQSPKKDSFHLGYPVPESYVKNKHRFTSVNQSIDVWSLGCVFSTAAVWVSLGYQSIQEFLSLRRKATTESNKMGWLHHSATVQAILDDAKPPGFVNSRRVYRHCDLMRCPISYQSDEAHFRDHGGYCFCNELGIKHPRETTSLDDQLMPPVYKFLPSRKVCIYEKTWECGIPRRSQIHAFRLLIDRLKSLVNLEPGNCTISSKRKAVHKMLMLGILCLQIGCWLVIERYRPQDGRSIGPRGSSNFIVLAGSVREMNGVPADRLIRIADLQLPSIETLWSPVFAHTDSVHDPAPPTFLAACTIIAVTTVLFQHLRQQDRFRKQFLLSGIMAGLVFSILRDSDAQLLHNLQCFLPGAIIMILPSSVVVHGLGRYLGYTL